MWNQCRQTMTCNPHLHTPTHAHTRTHAHTLNHSQTQHTGACLQVLLGSWVQGLFLGSCACPRLQQSCHQQQMTSAYWEPSPAEKTLPPLHMSLRQEAPEEREGRKYPRHCPPSPPWSFPAPKSLASYLPRRSRLQRTPPPVRRSCAPQLPRPAVAPAPSLCVSRACCYPPRLLPLAMQA